MNKEKQRIKIAEVCGWKPQTFCTDYSGTPWPDSPPDYCNDLNAMHEAENILTAEQKVIYSDYLYDTACELQKLHTNEWRYITATAAQRAEAFLKTLGLWEEAE